MNNTYENFFSLENRYNILWICIFDNTYLIWWNLLNFSDSNIYFWFIFTKIYFYVNYGKILLFKIRIRYFLILSLWNSKFCHIEEPPIKQIPIKYFFIILFIFCFHFIFRYIKIIPIIFENNRESTTNLV